MRYCEHFFERDHGVFPVACYCQRDGRDCRSERHSRTVDEHRRSAYGDTVTANGHTTATATTDERTRATAHVRRTREPVWLQLLWRLTNLLTASRHLWLHRVYRELLERTRLRDPVSRRHVWKVRWDTGFVFVARRQCSPAVRVLKGSR